MRAPTPGQKSFERSTLQLAENKLLAHSLNIPVRKLMNTNGLFTLRKFIGGWGWGNSNGPAVNPAGDNDPIDDGESRSPRRSRHRSHQRRSEHP